VYMDLIKKQGIYQAKEKSVRRPISTKI
jgi:hypothetical protein